MNPATEIYDDAILANLDGAISRPATEGILALGFSSQQQQRMRELAAKARSGELTLQERDEADSFERISSLLGILQSRAHIALKQPAS
ncbi:hypothetical protein [Blastopirellula marina]|uniref:Uncharacterized protein n=1 Tax=Blastopirellula marina DSM 3645 TaxID=314230 RepID=A3ZNE4_9BACT|nr:hypothetical protein [Blastopirellula marina]EAQ81839.1 hypothetical protein DSM3645_16845 [Blastopirellula marina DSM 3645]